MGRPELMYRRITRTGVLACLTLLGMESLAAKDYFLTIGGGYSPPSNQASLEKNVLLLQRLVVHQLDQPRHDVLFADGDDRRRDLKVVDRTSVPKANRLMAEFFGSERELGLSYRNHQVPHVRGAATAGNVRQWFNSVGQTLRDGDRLILYVTSHGDSSSDDENPYNTSISLWDDEPLTVTDFVHLLDRLPRGVRVVAIMVQCHAGGFARFLFDGADPQRAVSSQQRVGFFATVHDRQAAGCTPEVDEATYVEYSTYFWEALAGQTRMGEAIDPPDYDRNGVVSFDEAHAYTVLVSHTIDLPVKTSGEFLRLYSQFRDDENPRLLPENARYEVVLDLARPAERAVLEGLSKRLQLTGNARIEAARGEIRSRSRRGPRGRGRRFGRRRPPDRPVDRLRRKIADDLEERWPELANLLNPVAVELVSTRSAEFIRAVEEHPDYPRYRELADQPAERADPEKERVKYERFVRTAGNVILAENLRRAGDRHRLAQYQSIIGAERTSL